MKDILRSLGYFICTNRAGQKSSGFHSLTITFRFNFKISYCLKVRENLICETLAHGAGKTQYVPLCTAAAFSSGGADQNTDFIRRGLGMERISFQIKVRALRCSASQERARKPWEWWVFMFGGSGTSRSVAPRAHLSGRSRAWEHGAVYPVGLALANRSPRPSSCPGVELHFRISSVLQHRRWHVGCWC